MGPEVGEAAADKRGAADGAANTSWAGPLLLLWPGCAGSANCKNAGYSVFRFGERREWRVRLGLIPVGGRIEVVGAVVAVAVLDRHLDRFFKRDGALRVPAVKAVPAADAF